MFCEVIVDILNSQVDKIFDYILPEELKLKVGQRVLVPFANRKIEGYILKIKEASELDSSKLKSVICSLDDFSYLNDETINLMEFLIKTYNLRYADCLRLFVPNVIRKNVKEKFIKLVSLNPEIENLSLKFNEKQKEIIDFLKITNVIGLSELNDKFSQSSIKTLINKNALKVFEQKENRKPYNIKLENKQITLTSQQQNAIKIIKENTPNKFLLFGVTASGKTEVYIQVIKDVLNQGKTAILLVPEIGLTPQLFKRFSSVFGDNIAILHSGLSQGEKLDEWLKIKRGKSRVVIGARSAIFAPLENIGVIILDEEHDTSYYSETNPRYYAKEVAEFRAKFNKANLILGSATPSIETYYNAKNKDYILIEMKQRALAQKLPEVFIVDMLSEIRRGNASMFSKLLQMKLIECINRKEQALIFLNRRGFSSFIRCLDCGYIPKCEDCDVSLVYHKEDEKLKCHYCGNRYKVINKCPVCASNNIKLGAIGTEQVVEKLKEILPNIPVFRMDNDTTTNKNSHIKIIEDFNNTKPAILVGTQMIAKGHNFNNVSLVGIIDADLSLHYSDFRATDRAFNLLTQVSGRAGRTNLEGEVVLQTYTPKHFAYNCVSTYDYEKFYAKEINLRKVTSFPPFSKIVRVLASSEEELAVREFITEFYKKVLELKTENYTDFIYLDVMKSPVKRAKKQYRYQILMRLNLNTSEKTIEKLFEISRELNNKLVQCFVEIDPQNLS
ncbi:MAG: primosomal protein N' [Clostridiales bacterium]|nr:primosomal protein N' [Clostridiales bacterium]